MTELETLKKMIHVDQFVSAFNKVTLTINNTTFFWTNEYLLKQQKTLTNKI